MWPRFRKRGNALTLRGKAKFLELQCGRAFESAEIRRSEDFPRLQRRFNVAALSKARKSRGCCAGCRRAHGFNVAALSKARKLSKALRLGLSYAGFNVAALSKARK